jgi:hypothetical protein
MDLHPSASAMLPPRTAANGGIKISLIIQLFQGAFGKKWSKHATAISIAWLSYVHRLERFIL